MENLTVETAMALLLFVLVNLLVLAALGATLVFLKNVILSNPDSIEKLLRGAAFGSGLLIYVASKAMGMSIPELMGSALAVAAPLSFGFLGVVFPAVIGTFVAWYCLRLINQDDNKAARILVLFSAFFFTMFADTYASMATQAATSTSVDLILPNITFVLSVVLYTIFKYESKSAKAPGNPGGFLGDGIQRLKDRFKASPNGKEASEAKLEEPEEQPGAEAVKEDSRHKARNL